MCRHRTDCIRRLHKVLVQKEGCVKLPKAGIDPVLFTFTGGIAGSMNDDKFRAATNDSNTWYCFSAFLSSSPPRNVLMDLWLMSWKVFLTFMLTGVLLCLLLLWDMLHLVRRTTDSNVDIWSVSLQACQSLPTHPLISMIRVAIWIQFLNWWLLKICSWSAYSNLMRSAVISHFLSDKMF